MAGHAKFREQRLLGFWGPRYAAAPAGAPRLDVAIDHLLAGIEDVPADRRVEAATEAAEVLKRIAEELTLGHVHMRSSQPDFTRFRAPTRRRDAGAHARKPA